MKPSDRIPEGCEYCHHLCAAVYKDYQYWCGKGRDLNNVSDDDDCKIRESSEPRLYVLPTKEAAKEASDSISKEVTKSYTFECPECEETDTADSPDSIVDCVVCGSDMDVIQ